jgi:uncharacterized membrane protein required for colicin V production
MSRSTVALLTFVAAAVLAFLCGVAMAQPVPDPVADPVESVSFVVKLWKTGTLPATIIVAAFLALTFVARKVKALQKGYAALGAAAALGGLAILVEPASRGTTPTLQMVWMALLAAGAIAVKGKYEPTAPSEPK